MAMGNLKFNHESRAELERLYHAALAAGLDRFEFQGQLVLTDYAKYLLEFLEIRLGPSGHAPPDAPTTNVDSCGSGGRTVAHIDGKSDPGAWADHIASTGRFRVAAEEAVALQPVVEEQDAVIGVLRAEVARLHDIEQRMKRADNDATRFALEARRLRDKALAYDLDQAGIERRAAEAVELVEARAEIAALKADKRQLEADIDYYLTSMQQKDTELTRLRYANERLQDAIERAYAEAQSGCGDASIILYEALYGEGSHD